MVNNKWYLKTLEQTKVEGGYDIVTTTDVACHQWLRWSETIPQKHNKPIIRRGTVVAYDARFCFVAFTDIEQEEAGDTLEHTFVWRDWVHCQKRWFYFWATIAANPALSTTAWFNKHYTALPVEPEPWIFYPDADPEITSVDGYAWRGGSGLTWNNVHGGIGTRFNDTSASSSVQIAASTYQDGWDFIMRSIMLFDTSSIPPDSTILSAKVYIFGTDKLWNLPEEPAICLYESWPLTNTAVAAADYQNIDNVPFSDPITFADYDNLGWNEFIVKPEHLDKIIAGGITKLGFRESNNDAPNIEPTMVRGKRNRFNFRTADGEVDERPYLEVTFL